MHITVLGMESENSTAVTAALIIALHAVEQLLTVTALACTHFSKATVYILRNLDCLIVLTHACICIFILID